MKIAYDIGGVLSKFPVQFGAMIRAFIAAGIEIHVITDMHKREEVLEMLKDNGFGCIPEENVHCADYTNHGEFCKAILLKKLGIDMLFDDFVGYCQWDSALGPAPIRLLVAPDGFKPYWNESWKVKDNLDFGRRVTSLELLKDKNEQ